MWVKVETLHNDKDIIVLPHPLGRRFNRQISLAFGKRQVHALVETSKELNEVSEENSFENPCIIKISKKLAEKLELIDTLTYQIGYNHTKISIGPTIGLLLGNHNYLYNPEHMEKYSDRFGVYKQIGGLVYAFSAKSIDWDNGVVYGLYYDYSVSRWKYGRFPLPSVIYRRDFHTDNRTVKKLIEITNGKMFNSWRFTKLELYKYVKRNRELAKYLPSTELIINYDKIKNFINENENVILKPTDLSRGRGICIITKDEDVIRVHDYRNKETEERELKSEKELESFLESNPSFFTNYVIQKHLNLARVDGSPFDIRVVMQKEKPSEWKCTGIECRVAAQKILLTNISRGGYALTIDEALKKALPEQADEHSKIKQELDNLCHKLCRELDKMGPHFAEFGMDIALDENRRLWIIEVNVFPSFKGFKVMNSETYLDIRYTPMLYAAHLAGF